MNQNIESAIDHGTSNVSASVDALADKLADRLDDLLQIVDAQLLALRAALEWLEDLMGSGGCRLES